MDVNEMEVSVAISVWDDNAAEIEITVSDEGDGTCYEVSPDTDCDNADELAKRIGYEFLSLVDILRH